ncbi:MAG: ion transporter [Acidobacteria bacterium]|nr:ion transporter [Acidobacteriota bacterium]
MAGAEEVQSKSGVKMRVWEILDVAKPGDTLSKAFDIFILSLIFLNVVAVILGSVKEIEDRFAPGFYWFEVFSVVVFSIEYLGRVWSCVSRKEYSNPVTGRLSFISKPLSVIDLLAVLPFYLSFVGADLRFIRALRLFRIFRIAKLGRYSASVRLLGRVIKNKKEELVITVMVMVLLVVLASSFMYMAENEAQPDKFPDIPTAMWWSIVTLTTVGYGDVFPVTMLGKFFAGLIAILGIGMFALPTGIIGASFVEEIHRHKSGNMVCPHCGKEIG